LYLHNAAMRGTIGTQLEDIRAGIVPGHVTFGFGKKDLLFTTIGNENLLAFQRPSDYPALGIDDAAFDSTPWIRLPAQFVSF
jgi:hypothetical protein